MIQQTICGTWEYQMQESNDFKDWEASEMETEDVVMFDEGKGDKFVLRHFEYALAPDIDASTLDKQQLFNHHWKEIEMTLWEDGFVVIKEIDPRIVLQADKYRIFITCRPRVGLGVMTSINEEATTLQDIYKPKA